MKDLIKPQTIKSHHCIINDTNTLHLPIEEHLQDVPGQLPYLESRLHSVLCNNVQIYLSLLQFYQDSIALRKSPWTLGNPADT